VQEYGKYFEVNRVDLSEYDPINQIFLPTDENSEYISSPNVPSLAYYDWSQKEADCYTNIMKSKNEMNIADIDNYIWANVPECSETEKWFRNIGIKSTYNIPILYGSELMGFFCIDYTEKKYEMKNEELDFIRILAKQCGIALYQSILYEKEKQTANRENLLRSITSNTLLSNNLEDAIRKSTAAIGKLFDADRACFMFYDNTRKTFSEILGEYRRIEDMPSTEGQVLIPKEYEQFMIEELFIKKNILIYGSENESEIPESFKDYIKYLSIETSIPIKTIVGAPILFKDKPIGIILITNTESFGQWSKEKLDFLTPITQQISVGINLFQLNERLCKTLNSERTIKDIALESRKLEDYNQVWNYLLDRLTDIFGVDRALNLYFTLDGNLCICNEIIKNIDQAYSLGQDISNVKNTLEILPDEPEKLVVINDIDTDIKDSVLKEYFRSKRTYSLLLYPVSTPHVTRQQIQGIIMLCSSIPRKWTSDEIDSFKLIVDTTTLVYFEIKQRREAEEQRKTFLATLTHDMRSPIIGEQKALEAILSKRFGTSLENYSEFLEDIYKTNDELLRIVENILMTYHYESGRSELKLEQKDIKDIICDAVSSMSSLAEDQDSEITTNIQEDLPNIRVDKDEINRVIVNLLSNAIKNLSDKKTSKILSSEK